MDELEEGMRDLDERLKSLSEQIKILIIVFEKSKHENNVLRKLLAESNMACIYCKLPAEDIAKCEHGFPGCGRADDLLLELEEDYGPKETERGTITEPGN